MQGLNHRLSLLPHQSDQRLELGIGSGKFRGGTVSSELGTGDVGGVSGTTHDAGHITARAVRIAERLWNEGRPSFYRNLDYARRRGVTLLELIERRVQEWEARLNEHKETP